MEGFDCVCVCVMCECGFVKVAAGFIVDRQK